MRIITTMMIILGLLTLTACGDVSTSSQGCTSTTSTDANGNPINTVGCNG